MRNTNYYNQFEQYNFVYVLKINNYVLLQQDRYYKVCYMNYTSI